MNPPELNGSSLFLEFGGRKGRPTSLIRVYRPNSSGKYMPTDTIVGHKVSTLTKIEAL